MPVSTKFDMRDDPAVVRNYGRMLVDLASVIPDGIVAFFVSYSYMDTIVSKWDQMGVLQVSHCDHPDQGVCSPGLTQTMLHIVHFVYCL